MRRATITFVLALFALLPLFAPPAHAQQVRAWLDRDQISLGETATLNIEVEGTATEGPDYSPLLGDFHLAAFVGAALTGERTDDAGMLELLKPWAGQRQRVVRMLYASGFRKQAYGPRLSPEDHRRR